MNSYIFLTYLFPVYCFREKGSSQKSASSQCSKLQWALRFFMIISVRRFMLECAQFSSCEILLVTPARCGAPSKVSACVDVDNFGCNKAVGKTVETVCVCGCLHMCVYDSTVSVTVPLVLFRMPTASSCVTPSKVCPLTAMIWSPLFRRPSSAAAP